MNRKYLVISDFDNEPETQVFSDHEHYSDAVKAAEGLALEDGQEYLVAQIIAKIQVDTVVEEY
jgi:hypothetical protein